MKEEHRIVGGKFFVLYDLDQICGMVVQVIAAERRRAPATLLFAKGFYLLRIFDGHGLVTVIVDNDSIPLSTIIGENGVEGKRVVIKSPKAIAACNGDYRVINGNFFALRRVEKIHGRVKDVITEDRPDSSTPYPALFAKRFYFICIDEEEYGENLKLSRPTPILVDNDAFPSAAITGKNDILEKVVILEKDGLYVLRS